MNLFESFRNIVDPEFINKIKPNLDDNLGDFDLAIDGIYYTLVAGLIRRTNSDMSAGMLYNQIEEKYKKSSMPENLRESFFSKDLFNKISGEGSKIISQIFPAYKSPLISMISTYAGTSKNNTVLFSGMTASILIDILGSKIKKDKMDKDDLVLFLKQHHEALFKEAPENLMEKMIPALGLQELIHMKFNPNQKKTEKPQPATPIEASTDYKHLDESKDSDAPLMSKRLIIGLIAAAVLGAIGYYLYANRANISLFNSSKEEPEELIVDEKLLAPSADSLAKMKADSLNRMKSDTMAVVSADEMTPFNAYLIAVAEPAGKEFEFKSINYLPGKFEISPESNEVIDKLADVMKENPSAQIKILGFEANGDAKLANKRAFVIKRLLQEKGIKDSRIDAGPGGVGGDNPKIKVVSK